MTALVWRYALSPGAQCGINLQHTIHLLGRHNAMSHVPDTKRLALSDAAVAWLIPYATVRSYPRNAVLIYEGDDSDSFYLLLSGSVRIYVSDADGKELTLELLRTGDCFGEIAALARTPRSASAAGLWRRCWRWLTMITAGLSLSIGLPIRTSRIGLARRAKWSAGS